MRKEIEEKILIDGHVVWGHGTSSKELADRILENGITGNEAYGLMEMAIPLSDPDKTKSDNSQLIVNSLNNWPHKNCKYVIIVEIPQGHRAAQVTETFFDEKLERERSRLPSRFVKGYVNVSNYKLVENSLFQENAAPTITQTEKGLPTQQTKVGTHPPIPSVGENIEQDVW